MVWYRWKWWMFAMSLNSENIVVESGAEYRRLFGRLMLRRRTSHIRAVVMTRGHFGYTGQFPEGEEVCITAYGWKARWLAWFFRATKW